MSGRWPRSARDAAALLQRDRRRRPRRSDRGARRQCRIISTEIEWRHRRPDHRHRPRRSWPTRRRAEVAASIEEVVATLDTARRPLRRRALPPVEADPAAAGTRNARSRRRWRIATPIRPQRAEYGQRLAAADRARPCASPAFELGEALKSAAATSPAPSAAMFEPIDMLLVPAACRSPARPWPIWRRSAPTRTASWPSAPFNAPFDICGYPTITVPCGASADGIPIGFQLAAKPFAEALLCRAAHAFQGVTDRHRRRPEL